MDPRLLAGDGVEAGGEERGMGWGFPTC